MSFRRLILTTLLFIPMLACQKSTEDERRAANEKQIESFLKKNNLSYQKDNGIYHAIAQKGFGYIPVTNDTVSFWYVAYTLSGMVFDTNIPDVAEEFNLDVDGRTLEPLTVEIGNTNFLMGLNRGLLYCREHQWTTIVFAAELGFKDKHVGPVPPWSPIAYDIYINSVKKPQITAEKKYISTFVAKSGEFMMDSIGFWMKKQNLNPDGLTCNIGNTIIVKQKGYLLRHYNAETDQNSQKTSTIVLNEQHLPEGLMHSYLRLREGERAEVILPSSIAFGAKGNDTIPPYEPMIYQIEFESIQKND